MNVPIHPGVYIKTKIIPATISVKEAAALLGVGRPALSNLLNGKAALSADMAARIEKAFGAKQQELLQRQAEFEQFQQKSQNQKLAVRAYVPPFLTITAREIEQWVIGNLRARTQLPVLLRKLVHSTGQVLSFVDFPGYDNAEKKGWDGRVDAGAATPWIPLGNSGWEFGCTEDPKQKADGDYAARIKAIPAKERTEISFIFVTPRKWNGKDKWVREKQALAEWKSIRAYDALDLEQWLEQSVQAQAWLAEVMGVPSDGVHSLDEKWLEWSSVTVPELSKELFAPSIEHCKQRIKSWVENPSSAPLVVSGDSKLEALAFLYCLFQIDEEPFRSFKDRALVFSSSNSLRKLTTASPSFVPVVFTDEVERELAGAYKNRHSIIVRPRNSIALGTAMVLDLLRYDPFKNALEAMGIKDHHRIQDLARQAGFSPTVLRRRLSTVPAIRTPVWAQDGSVVRNLIPMVFVGAWHSNSKGDREVMSFLKSAGYAEVERHATEAIAFDDPPMWSVGDFRGVVSKIDAFFSVQSAVTQPDIEAFLFAAEMVLSESDPALDLPEDKRAFAGLYGKVREHSEALRDGVCETLVLLAVHGDTLFSKRLGVNIEDQIDALVRRLLTPLTLEKLLSQTRNLPMYAEAAPLEFLRIIENDLQNPDPQVFALMKPADTGLFGGGCPRTGLLWALENLAWKSEQLPRVCLVLGRLAERKIEDNWVNKPEGSLEAIFRSWMPQTAASLDDRKRALALLVSRFPNLGWKICVEQFEPGQRVGQYSHRPRWRSDASGAGEPVSRGEMGAFGRAALDTALNWPHHDETKLGDLITSLQGIDEEDQQKIWNLVDTWAIQENDEDRKATLREHIRRFAFLRYSAKRGIKAAVVDRARKAYDLLAPTDVVIRHHWLFQQQWVEASVDEVEGPEVDFEQREQRIRNLRSAALREIWNTKGFDGIATLLSKSGAAWVIGWHMQDVLTEESSLAEFLEKALSIGDSDLVGKFDEAVRGLLVRADDGMRAKLTERLLKVLSASSVCRYLKASPFQRDTWLYVDREAPQVQQRYWNEINPSLLMKNSPDLNESVDRLLGADRPRAAFHTVHIALEGVETSRLKQLLQEVGTKHSESTGLYQVQAYYLSEALGILGARAGVSEEEMAQLELLYIRALQHTNHGIPNLERQVCKSPALFVQALALVYRRNDGGQDPPEWKTKDGDDNAAIVTTAYRLLDGVKRLPGTEDGGQINEGALRLWVRDAQALCVQYGRGEVGNQRIGQLLSAPTVGTDGIWPREEVRKVLEEFGTGDMLTGVHVGVYNARGAHLRVQGGQQERDLADKYRTWARKLAFEYPFVAGMVEGIAAEYDRQAVRQDSQDEIERRLRH